ncbi:hypothetical protein K0U27_01945 [archaeon]|nr:hypothetical protein [archaeon]
MAKEQNSKSKIPKDAWSKKGIILLNACTNCGMEFKPINSMTYETSCNSCQEKTKPNQK